MALYWRFPPGSRAMRSCAAPASSRGYHEDAVIVALIALFKRLMAITGGTPSSRLPMFRLTGRPPSALSSPQDTSGSLYVPTNLKHAVILRPSGGWSSWRACPRRKRQITIVPLPARRPFAAARTAGAHDCIVQSPGLNSRILPLSSQRARMLRAGTAIPSFSKSFVPKLAVRSMRPSKLVR